MGSVESDAANNEKIRRYRSRADECRAHAAEMHYPETQASLMQIAQCYDKMADFMETARDDSTRLNQTETLPVGPKACDGSGLCFIIRRRRRMERCPSAWRRIRTD